MKKITIVLLAAVVVLLPSCKNQKKQAEADKQKTEVSEKEKLLAEDLKINVANLLESVKKMQAVPFISEKNGAVELSEKEKMVKPEYLVNPASISDLSTLSQKYRAVAMLSIDRMIAEMYEMPVAPYNAALAKLTIEINDEALKDFADHLKANVDSGEAIKTFCDKEYEAGRANLFWEAVTAGLVEQIYICTKNLDKFMPMFDDQSACDVTFDFICVHEGIMSMMEFYPEMESLNSVLAPLYVINAINVEQLRSQLTELKGEIEVVRAYLLQ